MCFIEICKLDIKILFALFADNPAFCKHCPKLFDECVKAVGKKMRKDFCRTFFPN